MFHVKHPLQFWLKLAVESKETRRLGFFREEWERRSRFALKGFFSRSTSGCCAGMFHVKHPLQSIGLRAGLQKVKDFSLDESRRG